VRPALVKLARRPALPADADSDPDGTADQA
jgi:hypothetical protein